MTHVFPISITGAIWLAVWCSADRLYHVLHTPLWNTCLLFTQNRDCGKIAVFRRMLVIMCIPG